MSLEVVRGYGSYGDGEYCLADNEYLFGMVIKFGNRHNSYTALWIQLMPLNYTFLKG